MKTESNYEKVLTEISHERSIRDALVINECDAVSKEYVFYADDFINQLVWC